jgi:hypothetical protein
VTFFLVYWNGTNLAINVVNNTIGLQVCDEFFLSDVIQLNEYIIIILSLSGVAKDYIATTNNMHNNVM